MPNSDTPLLKPLLDARQGSGDSLTLTSGLCQIASGVNALKYAGSKMSPAARAQARRLQEEFNALSF